MRQDSLYFFFPRQVNGYTLFILNLRLFQKTTLDSKKAHIANTNQEKYSIFWKQYICTHMYNCILNLIKVVVVLNKRWINYDDGKKAPKAC